MTVVRINNFGGLLPAVSERALPPAAASTASNLVAQLAEFRPTLAATTLAGVFSAANPLTIYRMQRTAAGALNTTLTTGWLSYASITYHARWPNNDDATERTTVSRNDGAYPPRVVDATGEDRLLGVPAPERPVVTLTEGDYYTEEDRENDVDALYSSVLEAIRETLDRSKIGAAYTNDTVEGYVEDGPKVAEEPSPTRARVYRFDARNGTLTDPYVSGLTPFEVGWVTATHKGIWRQSDTSTPTWMDPDGTWHYAVNYHAYGIGYKATEADITAAVDAIEHIETVQAEEIAERVTAMFDPANKEAQAVIIPLKQAVAKLEDVLNTLPEGSSTESQYEADVEDILTTAAREIWLLLYRNAGQTEIPGVTTGGD